MVFAKTAIITTAITTVAWLIATFVTSPESDQKLLSFYRRVHPSVYGWRRIAKLAPDMPEVRDAASNSFDWLMGCVMVYGCLFGIGELVFEKWVAGVALLVISALAGYLIFWDLSRRGWSTFSGVGPAPASRPQLGD